MVLTFNAQEPGELVALASDAAGNTSEFSDPILVRLFDDGFE